MKKMLIALFILVLLSNFAPALAQPGLERPVPPDGMLAMPWTLVGPQQDMLLMQMIVASHCLAYVHGLEVVYYDFQGQREIIAFIFFDEHRDPSRLINDVIWYEITLFPENNGQGGVIPPDVSDRLCGG